jgi:hypothetical protein
LLDAEFRASGLSPEQAERLTTLYYFVLSPTANPDEPTWKPLPLPRPMIAPSPDQTLTAAWSGKHLVAWGPIHDPGLSVGIWKLLPDTGTWSFSKVQVGREYFHDVSGNSFNGTIKTKSVGVGPKAILLRECAAGLPFHHMGSVIDLPTEAWRTVDYENAPTDRTGFQLMTAGNLALLWGGKSCLFKREARNDGFFYDPRENTWEAIPSPPGQEERGRPTLLWAGGQLHYWGGCYYEQQSCTRASGCRASEAASDCTNQGWVYDRTNHRWNAMPSEGAPSARSEPLAVAAGRYLIIQGGILSKNGIDEWQMSGARFDVHTQKWLPLRMPKLRYRELIWASPHVLAIGQPTGVSSYTPYRDTWSDFLSVYVPPGRPLFWLGSQLLVWSNLDSALLTP